MSASSILRYPVLTALPFVVFIRIRTAPSFDVNEVTNEGPVLPGQPCQTDPLDGWTDQEKWVWRRVCEGKVADFNASNIYGGELDPKNSENWPTSRIVQPEFLETILLHEPFRSALMRNGVQIAGAWFVRPLSLSNATLGYPLSLRMTRFEDDVSLDRLKSLHLVSLSGSRFTKSLSANGMQLEGDLFMLDAGFAEVALSDAKIGGDLAMDGSIITGPLNMASLQVESSLFMREAEFAEVNLILAQVGGNLETDGSKFSGELDMDSLQVESNLFMRGGAEFGEVNLVGTKVGGLLDLIGSKFGGSLDMDSLHVGRSLLMREAEFAEVDLLGARVEGNLEMDGSKFSDKLDMESVQVGLNLFMREAGFAEVDLLGAQVGDQLSMFRSTFGGRLDMASLQVVGSLLMREAEFAEVDLSGAKIGGDLSVSGSTFSGKLNMDSLSVESSLFIRAVEIDTPTALCLIFSEIGSNLDLSNSHLPSMDLTGTKIHGEFRLAFTADDAPTWQEDSKLILRNTEVGAIQDTPAAWPENLELEGFAYVRLGGLSEQSATNMAARDLLWFVEWLEKMERYSPQPYEQLASTLREAGRSDVADEVLYASRDRELRESTAFDQMVLMLQKVFIGYGYRIHYALYWSIGLTVVGMLVLRFSGQGPAHGMPYGFAYSLDMLLPIIRLRQRHYDIDLLGWARNYFYIHILMGYVLALFLIAGLTGLTK